jgi:exodeoxyribonuclease VII large subunit
MDQKLLHRLKVWRMQQARKEGVESYRVLPNTTLEEIARAKPLTPEDFFRIKGIKEGRWMKYGSMLLMMVQDAAGAEGSGKPASPSIEESVVESLFGISASAGAAGRPFGGVRLSPEERERRRRKALPAAPASQTAVGASLFDEQEAINKILEESAGDANVPDGRTLYTVSGFLEAINVLLTGMTVRVKGEVSSVDKRDRVVYFSLKDSQDESVVSCLAFRYHYDISGVNLEVGQEVIVEGSPEIYKPTGRFSLKVRTIELGGEGALKKAYDELKLKLEREGVFLPERKRALPQFPERIALITSNQGAAIGDFMMNLGSYGFKIRLLNSSVEGKRAVFDLIDAVRFFNRHPEQYDVLVMIRGGGSLESLQAFNSEALVREVAQSKIPVLAGIGHEKDVSLAALAADVMVSTPTATARALRESWEKAEAMLVQYEHVLLSTYEGLLQTVRRRIETAAFSMAERLRSLQERFVMARHRLMRSCEKIGFSLREKRERIARLGVMMVRQHASGQEWFANRLASLEERLKTHDPERILRLGYSLVMKGDRLVRSSDQIMPGETVDVKLARGTFEAKVEKVRKGGGERS